MVDGVFGGGRHLGEGTVMAVGPEDRVIAESVVAAQRPHQGAGDATLEYLAVTVGPAERQCGHELGATRPAVVGSQRLEFVMNTSHGGGEIARRAGPAGRTYPRRTVERRDRETGVVGERHRARATGRGARLQLGVGSKTLPGLLGLGQGEFGGRTHRDGEWRQEITDFTRFARVVGGHHQGIAGEPAGQRSAAPGGVGLRRHESTHACLGQAQQAPELGLGEGHRFRGPLNLDDESAIGEDEVGVDLGGRVLVIVEIEQGHAGDDPATDRGDMADQRHRRYATVGDKAHEGEAKRHPRPGDGGGPRSPVGLQDVAVDAHLALAEGAQVGRRAQRAADQALNLLGSTRLTPARRLSGGPGFGRARQHAVLGGDPPATGIAEKWRHPILETGGTQDLGIAEVGEARPFGVLAEAGL